LEGTTATKLNWVDTSTGETGFVLERKSEDQKTFEALATLQENITEYTDFQIVDGKIYQYRVKAISAAKPHSDWSNTATVNLPLLAPANLKAVTSGLRSVKLNWEDRSGNEKVYVVEKATQYGKNITAFSTVAELPANTTTYTDKQVQAGLMNYYRIVAKDSDQTSDYSNQISIRPVDDLLSNLKDKLLKSIDLFPNPASDLLTIITNLQLTETMKIQIANMQGVVLKTVEIKPGMNLEVQLNVGTWKEGLYVVQVTYQNLTVRKMLMVKR
jgi:fibronectin type 3 domain-containing protein